jgi:SAM-dependent methyltransferase
MNNPESNKTWKPKQALAPTPQLYEELVGNGMENLAAITTTQMSISPISSGSVILDAGCGTGAGTAAIVAHAAEASGLTIKGVDINQGALAVYTQNAAQNKWPAEAINEDVQALSMPDSTFTHALGTAFLFVLPSDGVHAIREIYRTLKPGGVAAFNSWAYVPNMEPIQQAAKRTRPEGTPLPRNGMDKWEDPGFLQRVLEEGGFSKDNITLTKGEVHVTTTSVDRYATMLWSFIGGTTTVGWLESDEANWNNAVEIVKEELSKSDGFKELDGQRLQLKFVANIAVATK